LISVQNANMRSVEIERLISDPRVTVRRSDEPDGDGAAVVYWMQRSQRATDNPALETAIAAANAIGKSVIVYFGLIAGVAGANLRHYQFMVEGLRDVAEDLTRPRIAFMVRKSADRGFIRFCDEVRPAVVVSDENPLRAAERSRQKTAVPHIARMRALGEEGAA
jgi:deoxyribodipyrimidine photo-lyase